MKNLRDPKTKIYPSTTRGGKELSSSFALDSPSVMSKLATPTPASAIRSDMSHVIVDATSAMHDAYDDTTSLLDNIVPLGEFLDEQLARVRENEITETDDINESDDEESLFILEGYLFDQDASLAILACKDRYELKRLLAKWNKQSPNARMKHDPSFATSPIFVTDKDYEFSVDPEIITLLNLILSMAMNLELLWHILLN